MKDLAAVTAKETDLSVELNRQQHTAKAAQACVTDAQQVIAKKDKSIASLEADMKGASAALEQAYKEKQGVQDDLDRTRQQMRGRQQECQELKQEVQKAIKVKEAVQEEVRLSPTC